MALPVGTEAPEFELPLKPGEAPLRLEDYRGEKVVVLLFFPLAFSSVCTDEMCSVAEDYGRWKEMGAEVIGISVDSPFANQKFAEECGATFPIVSDFNREAAKAYDVLNEDYYGLQGVAYRSAFVVARDGTIVYAWETEDASVMPAFEEILKAVEGAG